MSNANQSRASPVPKTMRQAVLTTDVAKLSENGEPPRRIPLHPFGDFRGNGKDFVFDDVSLEAIRAQQADRGVDWVLDWHHQTLQQEEGLRDDAPAAGWIADVVVEGGWVYGIVSDWTPKAALAVVEKAYRFVSAVFRYDSEGRVRYYHSFGLVNRPGTHYQRQIGLSAEDIELETSPPEEKEEEMDERLKALLTALGLAEDATQEQITATLSELQGQAALGQHAAEVAGLESAANTAENRGRLISLASAKDSVAEVASLASQLESLQSTRVDTLIAQALSDGKITPPNVDFWRKQANRDYAGTQAALAAQPRLVPLESLATKVADDKKTAALEEGQENINQLLGVSTEQFLKFNGGG